MDRPPDPDPQSRFHFLAITPTLGVFVFILSGGRAIVGVTPKGGAEMRAEMKTQKRIANYQIDQMFRERVPFKNYNASIVAENNEGLYSVWHWDTHLFSLDTNTGRVLTFNLAYYSQTTSTLQGRIVRELMTREQVAELYRTLTKQGDTRNARRLRGMARMR